MCLPFAYLVELELCDDNLGGGDGNRDGLAVALLADDCMVVSVGRRRAGTMVYEPPLM